MIPLLMRNADKEKKYLFFLEDDFLLQHFDGVELAVGFVLGKQDLHDGFLVSGLFCKYLAPASWCTLVSGHFIKHKKIKAMHAAKLGDVWKQLIRGEKKQVLTKGLNN